MHSRFMPAGHPSVAITGDVSGTAHSSDVAISTTKTRTPALHLIRASLFLFVARHPQTALTGTPNLTNARFQIDLFGREKIALDTLAEGVKTAMLGATLFKSICLNQMDLYEDPAQFYRISLDFSVWYY